MEFRLWLVFCRHVERHGSDVGLAAGDTVPMDVPPVKDHPVTENTRVVLLTAIILVAGSAAVGAWLLRPPRPDIIVRVPGRPDYHANSMNDAFARASSEGGGTILIPPGIYE